MKKHVGPLLAIVLAFILVPNLYSCAGDEVSPNSGPQQSGMQPNLGSAANMGDHAPVITGAELLITKYMDRLKDKRVAIVANQTSLVFGKTHLVDTLHSLGVNIQKVFAPEHGFRGDHDAGASVNSAIDGKTGIKIESLYGTRKKPNVPQMADIDIVLFDIQDVGARFYTYISTMSYVMEACAEMKKQFLVLDRPNPNGWYVDGPVLEKGNESFVGMHHIPIVHGMTIGEYAQMVNGEGWLKGGVKGVIDVIKCENYDHSMKWEATQLEWIPPSPNLATPKSAYLYPIFCWYEGMPVSVGRGTDEAFEMFGAPWHEGYHYQIRKDSFAEAELPGTFQYYGLQFEYVEFTPKSMPGKSTKPKYLKQECYGARPLNQVDGKNTFLAGIALLKNFQEETGNVETFKGPLFKPFFARLAGTKTLAEQIKSGMGEKEIYESWRPALAKFKLIRRKYLLYPDFEEQG